MMRGEPADDEEACDAECAAAGDFVYVDRVLQPLADGFPDRPLTLVVVDDPGTRDGLYASDMADAVADISPVEIVVSYEPHPQGGTIPTMSLLIERNGGLDGYYPEVSTLVGTPTDFHIENIEEDWGLSMDGLQYIFASEELPYVLLQRADAPWGETFDDFVEYGRQNPGELRYISGGVGSGHDDAGNPGSSFEPSDATYLLPWDLARFARRATAPAGPSRGSLPVWRSVLLGLPGTPSAFLSALDGYALIGEARAT